MVELNHDSFALTNTEYIKNIIKYQNSIIIIPNRNFAVNTGRFMIWKDLKQKCENVEESMENKSTSFSHRGYGPK